MYQAKRKHTWFNSTRKSYKKARWKKLMPEKQIELN